MKNSICFLLGIIFVSSAAVAQDSIPHRLQGSLPVPKLGLKLRGRYTIALAPGPSSNEFRMEILPTYFTGTSDRAIAKARRDFSSIAKLVCGDKSAVLLGELAMPLSVYGGGSGVDNVTGVFHCEDALTNQSR